MEYSSLDFARFETRFLRLAAPIGDVDDQLLRFDVEIGSVSNPPELQALSYCWGKELGKARILVGTTEINVSTNLEAALRSSALVVGNCIWVDAICINQKDLHEKSYQVRMMGQIYSRATRVIAWLGVEAPHSHAAAGLVNKITDLGIRERRHIRQEDTVDRERYRSLILHRAFDEVLAKLHRPSKVMEGLAELLNRSYWERVWIIQEVSKASVVVVRCGQLVMDLHTLLCLRIFCGQLSIRTRTLLAAISEFRAQELRNHGRMSLVQALITSRASVSTDERDKVYALLGLAGDSEELMPLPSYAEDVSAIFMELTRKIMESPQPSNVLGLARRSPLKDRFTSVPVWCVDWAQLELGIPGWVAKLESRSQPLRPWFQNSVLHVQGHRIGRTTSYEGDISSLDSNTSPDPARSFQVIKNLAFDIIDRLSSSKGTTTSVNESDLVYALSRMIKDENKGVASADYNLLQIGPVLKRLGSVQIDYRPILEWAKCANFERSRTLGGIVEHVEQEPPDSSTHWGGIGRLLQIVVNPTNAQVGPEATAPKASLGIESHFYKIWEHILADFNDLAEMQMEFAVLEDRHLVLLPRYSRRPVYALSNCTLPVVLQKRCDGNYRSLGDFRFLGEAFIAREKGGQWVSPPCLDDACIVQDEMIRVYLGSEDNTSREFF